MKVQFSVSVDADVRDRLDALRIVCGGISRSKMTEKVILEGGLEELEVRLKARLKRLRAVARAKEQSLEEFLQDYNEQFHRQTYSPDLEVLERSAPSRV